MSRETFNTHVQRGFWTLLIAVVGFGVNKIDKGFGDIVQGMEALKATVSEMSTRGYMQEFRITANESGVKECRELLKNHEGRLIILERPK